MFSIHISDLPMCWLSLPGDLTPVTMSAANRGRVDLCVRYGLCVHIRASRQPRKACGAHGRLDCMSAARPPKLRRCRQPRSTSRLLAQRLHATTAHAAHAPSATRRYHVSTRAIEPEPPLPNSSSRSELHRGYRTFSKADQQPCAAEYVALLKTVDSHLRCRGQA